MTYSHKEFMTNSDVASMLQAHALPDKKKKTKEIDEAPIYGPHIPPIEHSPSGSKNGKLQPISGVYPDIYGPDIATVPGTKPKKPKHESDNVDDEIYDFNPDLKRHFQWKVNRNPF